MALCLQRDQTSQLDPSSQWLTARQGLQGCSRGKYQSSRSLPETKILRVDWVLSQERWVVGIQWNGIEELSGNDDRNGDVESGKLQYSQVYRWPRALAGHSFPPNIFDDR